MDSNGLSQIIISKEEPQLIVPLGKTEEKLEREFYKPAGKKLVMEMENTGTLGWDGKHRYIMFHVIVILYLGRIRKYFICR